MRILMVHPHDIHSKVEPWTRRIKSFAEELAKMGHMVKLVYFPLSAKTNLERHLLNGYEAIPLSRRPSPAVFLKNILELINLAGWADILHFQKCHHYAAVPAVLAAYFRRKPLHYDWDDWEEMIWYESCGMGLHSRFIGFSFKILERFLPTLSDSVSVASKNLRDLAVRYGVNEQNIYFAHVGANLDEFNPRIKGDNIRKSYNIRYPLVLYIGQLHGAQYIDLFIKAANLALHKNPKINFMIVGEGFMESSLKSLASELGIQDKVIFAGSVRHHMIPELIAAADICVAPFKETKVTLCKSPLKIAEYMACGKSILASNVGEVRRMLGGVGFLVEAGDHGSMAEGILRLINDSVLRENLGKFARKRAEENHSWHKSASTLLRAYKSILWDRQT